MDREPVGPALCLRNIRTISEVFRAVSPSQESGQAVEVSPLSPLRITGASPIGALQEMRRAAEAQIALAV